VCMHLYGSVVCQPLCALLPHLFSSVVLSHCFPCRSQVVVREKEMSQLLHRILHLVLGSARSQAEVSQDVLCCVVVLCCAVLCCAALCGLLRGCVLNVCCISHFSSELVELVRALSAPSRQL
jgi:hypothetical protein